MLVKKVASFISKNNLISKGDRIAVALSGGRDSVALLHILNHLKIKLHISLTALHINHGIRGKESDTDQEFVEELCQSLGIKCTFVRLTGFSMNSGEDALRKARYTIFDEVIEKENFKIATGHHLNDQLETYIMRLFKGSGVKGLLAIPVLRGNYIRPLLHISGNEIDTYCEEKNIAYRNDSTNALDDKLRNKVRLKLIPQIEEIFSNDFLKQFLKSHSDYKKLYTENLLHNYGHFKKVSHHTNNEIQIQLDDFNALSKLQKAQYLEYCFSYVYGLDCLTGKEQISEFEKFTLSAQTGTKFLFADSIEALKDRDKLIFYPSNEKSEKNKKLYLDKSIKFGKYSLLLNKVAGEVSHDTSKLVENICADKIRLPLTVRSWKKGDYFYPLGKTNRQKLSDFFINNKVTRINKNKIPIILNEQEIVWVAGFRIDNRYKITKKCQSVFKLEIVYE